MKYSGRRSYAFLALAALEKGATVKNEARFWSRELGCREYLGEGKGKKGRKTQNISPGLSVWESQCKHNRQLFLDSRRGMKFSAGAEIHQGKMCELLKRSSQVYTRGMRKVEREIFLIFATGSTDPSVLAAIRFY